MCLKAVPVCIICKRSSEVSISCTNCYQICCATCLNLRSDIFDAIAKGDDSQIRKCLKCLEAKATSVAIKAERCESEPSKTSAEPSMDRRLCKLHRRDCKLYCSQCQMAICSLCIDEDQPHELHHIDNFSIVYREKVSQLNSKLDQAKKLVDSLGACSAVCDWNLKLLEKVEDVMLREIDAVSESSKLKVTRQTSIRKERLRAQLQLPVERDRTVTEIRDKVRNHSADDLMANLSELDQICTTLATAPKPNNIPLEAVDDLECDLIPAYKFTRITAEGLFQKDTYKGSFLLPVSHDIVWTLYILKTDKVQLILSHSDSELLKFPHKLVAIIPHTDSQKEIRQTFDRKASQTTFDLVPVSRLVELGFNDNSNGNLTMKIGIRPANAVVEKQLLAYQYDKLKNKNRSTELNLKNAETKLNAITGRVDYGYFCMYYTMRKDQLNKGFSKSSLHITDYSDRRWRLNVYFHNDVGVYIELCSGFITNYNFFIELRNEDPYKTILKLGSSVMGMGNETGFHDFIKWNQLMGDGGFFLNGVLHFRFGVCPLPTLSVLGQ